MKSSKLLILGTLAVSLLMVAATPASAKIDVTSLGFRANQGGGGKLDLGWGGGNMGNTWTEGEWVPYQLVLTKVQESYPNLAGMPNIEISYDFTTSGSRFVDLVRGLQVGTTELNDEQGWPQDDGSAYPMTTRAEIEDAQNDVGNTAPLDNVWTGFQLLNLPDGQINVDLTNGTGTTTDAVRKFVITPADLTSHGIDPGANTIVIYYQLHESRTFIWSNSLQDGYDASPTDAWGGYVYGDPPFSTDSRTGAGYVPGSSGHVHVLTLGGSQDVPIPIPETLPGAVSGMKWEDLDGDGEMDGDELPLSGWRIYVYGNIEGIDFMTSTLTDADGLYSFPDLTSGTWTIAEATDREDPAETGYLETYPYDGASIGTAVAAVGHSESGQAAWAWEVTLSLDVPDQADVDFGNFFVMPDIDIEKYVNGDDADSPTGPVVLVGDTVTFDFVVTNTGNIALSNVVVTDDILGEIGTIASLGVDESQTLTVTAPAAAGQQTNIGTATGTPPVGPDVSDTDPGNYFGADPDIDIEKYVNGIDADTATGPIILVGQTVTFDFVVTNTGNVELTDVLVTDDVLGTIGTIASLGIGASETLTATDTAAIGQQTNIGTATGTPPVGPDVSDTDPGNYFGANPAIDLEKLVNDEDADIPTGPVVPVGSTVTFDFVVTNIGNVALTNVEVTDSILGTIGTIASLAAGASQTLTVTDTAIAGQYTNLGTVTTYEGPTDSDPGNYFGADPGVDLEKHVNGEDADSPTGPVVAVGSTVTFEFVVTNTGNITLTNLAVTDDVLGSIGTIASLAPGSSQTLTATAAAVAGQHTNNGTVTTDQGPTDDDPGNYYGSDPSIDLEKYVNGEDADSPTGPVVPVGSTVTFDFVVTNTGNITLTNVAVSDDILGPIGIIASLAPGASQTLTAYAAAISGQYTNIGSVTTDQGPADTDPGNYFGEEVVYCYDETAYGLNDSLGAACFLDLDFDNWGWTHGPLDPADGPFEFDLWAGAAHCDTDEGFYVGWVTVDYTGSGVDITYNIDPEFEIISEHVYVGSDPVPYKGSKPTVSPGQYYIKKNLTGEIYIIYHAVVEWCE
jgi:hypothetical protein